MLHQRLLHKHKLRVGRDTVMMLSAVNDPDGALERKKHKLKRREYHSKGPDFIWHMDGYKLKPFGFAIHGCIDGYSRQILWLYVSPSNNDPYIIAGYYLECVRTLKGCPTIVRSDRGTENCNVAFLQPFLRESCDDQFRGEKSFMYGKSTSNQRIEAWWGQLRKNGAGWWMDFFKELRTNGELDDSCDIQMDCLRFSFMSLIQQELIIIANEWNVHTIRQSAQNPGGVPDVLYFLPHQNNCRSYKHPIDNDDIEAAEEYSCLKPEPTSPEFKELAELLMAEAGINSPTNADEGLALYRHLKSAIL
ncbi:uncharacterized protein [Dysidea avara]|uniref:uncharacterized protein isoform X1 n=2 Tax=Dysidea avara TaxID=196820 RepID=UPI0033318E97